MFRTRFKTSLIGLSISLVLMALLRFASAGRAFADSCGASICTVTFTGASSAAEVLGTGSNGANAPTLTVAHNLNGTDSDTLTITLPVLVTDGYWWRSQRRRCTSY